MTNTLKIKTTVTALLATIAFTAVFATNALAWNDPSSLVFQSAPGKCLDDTGWSRSAGTKLQLWSCLNHANQQWAEITLQPAVSYGTGAGPALMMYRNLYSGLCLDVPGNSSTPGVVAIQWYCNENDPAERFYQIISWAGDETIRGGSGGNCLDDWHANTANGTPVDFYPCNGGTTQQILWY